MVNKNKIEKDKMADNWLGFSQSYLLMAKLACQELMSCRVNKFSRTTEYDPPEFSINYQPLDLFIPIIFNIKHGIEVFIKTLTIFSNSQYQKVHDIERLFDELIKILPKKIKPIKNGDDEILQKDIDSLTFKLKEIESLILKYYRCSFLEDININDASNDAFRYPENKAKLNIDLERVDIDLIKNIHSDIDKIYRLFNDIGYIIDVYNDSLLNSKD